MIKVVSWNIARRQDPWSELLKMDADVALLQEAGRPPTEVADVVEFGQGDPWLGGEFDRWPLVVRLSDRVRVEWLTPTNPATETKEGEIAVSDIGTIAAARVVPLDGADSFIAVSMYSRWLNPHASTGSSWIYSDASAHRIMSDLSTFIGHVNPYKHRILAAGDLNILHGYGLGGSPYWAARDRTVFDRMESLKLSFVGPQAPHGRQADPWPDHMPPDSKNVPTYYHIPTQKPPSATFQLDYVFASRGFHESVAVHALNSPEEWGPSDHCRLEILVS